jgi:hypothetical protein|tara:strand:+ start:110 stop:790 length:681 start_codon:yes stop_codon:yes gene_type:complete
MGLNDIAMKAFLVLCLLALFAAAPAPLRAGELVAIVEQSEGNTGDVQLFDMLEAGRVITLGAGGRLVLGYLRSCWRETITGGEVTVGTEHGTVKRGRVYRELVECDGGSLILADALSDKSGAMVYRAPPGGDSEAPPQVILFSLTPAFHITGAAAQVTVERLDAEAPPLALALEGGMADLAATAHRLAPGGRYRASADQARVTFAIDRLAEAEGGPLIGRIIFLNP